MATVSEMREWLKDNGHDVPERGRLRPELVAEYKDAHDDFPPADDTWPSDADLEDAAAAEPAEVAAETRPTRPRTRRAPVTARAESLLGRVLNPPKQPAGKGRAKAKPKHPRVGLDRFITRVYSSVGRMIQPLSPATSNCLRVQGPMAGVILNDVVAGTVADRFLQPMARAEDKANKVFALAAPPVACFGLEMAQQMAEGPDKIMRLVFWQGLLREGLRTGLEVSRDYAEQIVKAAERNAELDAEVDQLIGMIFAPPDGVPVPEPEMAGAAA